MYAISFENLAPVNGDFSCPVCRNGNPRAVLVVSNEASTASDLHLVECPTCGTMYFADENPVTGYEQEEFSENYWYNYVQNGAGISAMLEPLLAVRKPGPADLLDVGCGFGFVPHFWREMGFGDAIGLEKSAYGGIGAEKLGISIIPHHYSDASEIQNRRFDFVLSSEVIEHVPDPANFIKEISSALKPGGILILTTPSVGKIRPDAPEAEILTTLSPGFHYFIFSRTALENIIKQCGFEHVVVRDQGYRLFAWASHQPFPEPEDGFSHWPIYFKYLENLSMDHDQHIASGAMYRALKDSINLGKFSLADRIYPKFEALCREKFDLDFRDIGASQKWRRSRTSLDNARYPSWMGCALLYAGLQLKRKSENLETCLSLFAAAIETMQKEIELTAQFAGEPAYFISIAKKEYISTAQTLNISAGFDEGKQPAYILRAPTESVDLDACLLAVYAPTGEILPETRAYIDLLYKNGISVIAVVAVNDPVSDINVSGLRQAAGIIVRKNGGFDFASWSDATRLFPQIWTAKRLIFTNDSIIALPASFPNFIDRLRDQTADYVAVTESVQITHHAQSYFFMTQRNALKSVTLQNFWKSVKSYQTKQEVIELYETQILSKVTEWNLSSTVMFQLGSLFPDAKVSDLCKINVTHHYWEYLIRMGVPFVKLELLRDNPIGLPILHWPQVLRQFGVDDANVAAHIEASKRSRYGLSGNRSELLGLLRDLNNVRRKFLLRRRARKEAKST
ncbi:MAG: methyltransferase domain-containing protein [Pseudomonadota bacterium]